MLKYKKMKNNSKKYFTTYQRNELIQLQVLIKCNKQELLRVSDKFYDNHKNSKFTYQ